MEFEFQSRMIEWRGPSPFFFLPVPDAASAEINRVARQVSYGWGVIPVTATIADVAFATSLFPREGIYLLPVRDKVRRGLTLTVGDLVSVSMSLRPREG